MSFRNRHIHKNVFIVNNDDEDWWYDAIIAQHLFPSLLYWTQIGDIQTVSMSHVWVEHYFHIQISGHHHNNNHNRLDQHHSSLQPSWTRMSHVWAWQGQGTWHWPWQCQDCREPRQPWCHSDCNWQFIAVTKLIVEDTGMFVADVVAVTILRQVQVTAGIRTNFQCPVCHQYWRFSGMERC